MMHTGADSEDDIGHKNVRNPPDRVPRLAFCRHYAAPRRSGYRCGRYCDLSPDCNLVPNGKLAEDHVRQIRKQYADGGIRQRQLAEKYGVHTYTVECVLRGLTWQGMA
jgi:hypothetical protein